LITAEKSPLAAKFDAAWAAREFAQAELAFWGRLVLDRFRKVPSASFDSLLGAVQEQSLRALELFERANADFEKVCAEYKAATEPPPVSGAPA
jgi:hypothetical protein